MANFAGHPETFTFDKLTMTRGTRGEYAVTIEGIKEPIASVLPYDQSSWGWLHLETGRSGMVQELAAAGAAIEAIESTRD